MYVPLFSYLSAVSYEIRELPPERSKLGISGLQLLRSEFQAGLLRHYHGKILRLIRGERVGCKQFQKEIHLIKCSL